MSFSDHGDLSRRSRGSRCAYGDSGDLGGPLLDGKGEKVYSPFSHRREPFIDDETG